jgi:CDP-diacylglycerol--glycerol-3-phosphate 3-phosphatidyltransferase
MKELLNDKFFTVSNGLSLLRIFLAPVVAFIMHREALTGQDIYLCLELVGLFIIIISDFLDGFLARTMDQVTRLGQYLDPIADKISAVIIAFAIIVYRDFPVVVVVVAVAREVVVVWAAGYLFSRRRVVVSPNLIGKATVALMSLSGFLYIIQSEIQVGGLLLKEITAYLIIPFYVLSGILYIKKYARYWLEKSSS